MRKSISTLVVILILITSYISANPGNSDLQLINGMGIYVNLNDESQKDIFTYAEYSNEYEVVLLETKRKLNYFQLINDKGIIVKKISVNSKSVEIEKSIFDKGKYLMGLKLDGQSQVEFINVIVE